MRRAWPLLLALARCAMAEEDARMLLAGAGAAAAQKPGLQRLQILSVTCGRVEACARGCRPVLEGFADAPADERFVLFRRCPDLARAVPAADEARMTADAERVLIERLSALLPDARKALPAADGARLECELSALRGERSASGC